MTAIRLDGLTHDYGPVRALTGLSLSVPAGECLVLLGPTGSGKSTLLRLLAGLETPRHGHILVDGIDVTHTPLQARRAALVGQRHLLYPHLSVRDNLAFGLTRPDLTPAIDLLRLGPLLERLPAQLSGGQFQRVALGRALARRVRLMLLDEPLGHLDPPQRWELLCELPLLRAAGGFTMIYVTHEQEEAFALGDRVAVLDDGKLLQVGTPREVHDRPSAVTAARLLGWPPINVLRGTLRRTVSGVTLERPACPVQIPLPTWGRFDGREVLLGSRPDAGLPLPLTAGRSVAGPSRSWVAGSVGGERVVVGEGDAPFDPAKVHLFDATTGEALLHGAGP